MFDQTFTRRNFLSTTGTAAGAIAAAQTSLSFAADEKKPLTRSDESLKQLIEGNARYMGNRRDLGRARRDEERRQEVAESQEPFALIFTCADSRVIPEVIFNKGIGDLFVIRVAGNFVTERCFGVLGSIEYAVQFLHVPLIMVLGHERCGAVKAALNLAKKDQRPPGNIGIIADEIRPAMKEIEGQPGDLLHNAVVANVKLNAARLAKVSPVIRKHIEDGSTRIVGADYDLDTGRVNLIGP
jgi:carbonic anhydrase